MAPSVLAMHDANGKRRLNLGVTDDATGLVLSDSGGTRRLTVIFAEEAEQPGISLLDPAGATRAAMLYPASGPTFRVFAADGSIAWSSPSGPPTEPQPEAGSHSQPSGGPERILEALVSNKHFVPADYDRGRFRKSVVWDCEYTAVGLRKPARAIKGELVFCDLFHEPQLTVRTTIDDAIEPGDSLAVRSVGIDYVDILQHHRWLLNTDLQDMVVLFNVTQILYADGTKESF